MLKLLPSYAAFAKVVSNNNASRFDSEMLNTNNSAFLRMIRCNRSTITEAYIDSVMPSPVI